MLDTSIGALTGKEPVEAWASIFNPGDRVAIKVNAISGAGYWTHVPLVLAVAERLEQVGIAAEQIVIFDRHTRELQGAGYPINRDGPGIRCYGTDSEYASGWQLMEQEIGFSQILLNCDALINMPILKQHGMAGVSLALKNHYGTFDKPSRFHSGHWMERGMAELSTLPPIRDRTRLIIGDALAFVGSDWYRASPGDGILMSRDPVAHDRIGLELISEVITNEGRDPSATRSKALGWLSSGTELGLGTSAIEQIPLQEVTLT
jgi:hypothetical protein